MSWSTVTTKPGVLQSTILDISSFPPNGSANRQFPTLQHPSKTPMKYYLTDSSAPILLSHLHSPSHTSNIKSNKTDFITKMMYPLAALALAGLSAGTTLPPIERNVCDGVNAKPQLYTPYYSTDCLSPTSSHQGLSRGSPQWH